MDKLYPKTIEMTKNLIKQMENIDGASVSLDVGEQLINTIEALQQEIKQLEEGLKQIQYDIDGAECRDDLDGIKGYIDTLLDGT